MDVGAVAQTSERLESRHPSFVADRNRLAVPATPLTVTWLLDLDGVVWLADDPIPGSADAVARLRGRGERVVVATNNSSMTVGEYLAKLERMGLATAADDVITSAQASARLVEEGERVLVCAGPGVREALSSRGAVPVDNGPADAVVVGWNRNFDYDMLTRAMRAVRAGARLIGTNDDATYPIPGGLLPGGGSLVAAVSVASGVDAVIAGKPYPPMVDAVLQRFGPIETVVGDRPNTDGVLAKRLGARFALVLTGVTHREDLPVEPVPDVVADDLASLVGTGANATG
jgi:4-nitrophenyl phosphatase